MYPLNCFIRHHKIPLLQVKYASKYKTPWMNRLNQMARILLAPPNSYIQTEIATLSPEHHPPPPYNLGVPSIEDASRESDRDAYDNEPPKADRVLLKEVNIHAEQARAEAKRDEKRNEEGQLLEPLGLLDGLAGFLDRGLVHGQSYAPGAHLR